MPAMEDRPERRLLRGWKEIGAYLGAAPRSAQRYAAELGLPVHRAGQRRGSVSAFTDELDAWVRRRTESGESAEATLPDTSAPDDSTAGADAAPQGPTQDASGEGARRQRWALRTGTALGIIVLSAAGWLWLGRARVPGVTDAGAATRAARTGPAANRQYTLRVTYPDGSAMNVGVTEQRPAEVQLSAEQTLILQPTPRGALLRVDLFEKDAPALADGARRLVGTAELVASRADAPTPARLFFSSGVLEVAWIADPAPRSGVESRSRGL